MSGRERVVGRIGRLVGRHGKRIVVGVVGLVVLLIGLAMIVLPGPALLVIPAGLAILATQFDWAQRALDRVRERAGAAVHRLREEHGRHGQRVTELGRSSGAEDPGADVGEDRDQPGHRSDVA